MANPVAMSPTSAMDAMDAMDTTSAVTVYVGTAGHSVWLSEDLGETFVHPNSHSGMYLEARVWSMTSHPTDTEHLFAGTDIGVFRWNESSADWTYLDASLGDVWCVSRHPRDPRIVFAGTRPAALFRSDDAGVSWTRLDVPDVAQFSDINRGPTRVTQILFDPIERDTVWAAIEIGGIYRSSDGGRTWSRTDSGLLSCDVHGLAVTRNGAGERVLLATTNLGLHRSRDNGANWTFQKLASPWQYTRNIVNHPASLETLFLTNGNGPPGTTGRLLRSTDGGDSWHDLGLPGALNSTPWCVAVHPGDPKLVFACTNLGQLFRSRDGGERWTRLKHEFGEVRALHWRPVPQHGDYSHFVTKRTVESILFAQSAAGAEAVR